MATNPFKDRTGTDGSGQSAQETLEHVQGGIAFLRVQLDLPLLVCRIVQKKIVFSESTITVLLDVTISFVQ